MKDLGRMAANMASSIGDKDLESSLTDVYGLPRKGLTSFETPLKHGKVQPHLRHATGLAAVHSGVGHNSLAHRRYSFVVVDV